MAILTYVTSILLAQALLDPASTIQPQSLPGVQSVQWGVKSTVTPQLPIDCGYAQPCTGTQCVHQTKSYFCDGTEYVCDNDTQNYTGGNVICCTSKHICTQCEVNGKLVPYYSYTGTTDAACAPNP